MKTRKIFKLAAAGVAAGALVFAAAVALTPEKYYPQTYASPAVTETASFWENATVVRNAANFNDMTEFAVEYDGVQYALDLTLLGNGGHSAGNTRPYVAGDYTLQLRNCIALTGGGADGWDARELFVRVFLNNSATPGDIELALANGHGCVNWVPPLETDDPSQSVDDDDNVPHPCVILRDELIDGAPLYVEAKGWNTTGAWTPISVAASADEVWMELFEGNDLFAKRAHLYYRQGAGTPSDADVMFHGVDRPTLQGNPAADVLVHRADIVDPAGLFTWANAELGGATWAALRNQDRGVVTDLAIGECPAYGDWTVDIALFLPQGAKQALEGSLKYAEVTGAWLNFDGERIPLNVIPPSRMPAK